MNYNKLSNATKKYWQVAYVECEDGKLLECAVSKDGLLFKFSYQDIQMQLRQYSTTGMNSNQVWYFNETRDRQIADTDGEYVNVNPQFVWQNFKQVLV